MRGACGGARAALSLGGDGAEGGCAGRLHQYGSRAQRIAAACLLRRLCAGGALARAAHQMGPGTLDIDILSYHAEAGRHGDPHPRPAARLCSYPLRDIAPGWRHPISGAGMSYCCLLLNEEFIKTLIVECPLLSGICLIRLIITICDNGSCGLNTVA